MLHLYETETSANWGSLARKKRIIFCKPKLYIENVPHNRSSWCHAMFDLCKYETDHSNYILYTLTKVTLNAQNIAFPHKLWLRLLYSVYIDVNLTIRIYVFVMWPRLSTWSKYATCAGTSHYKEFPRLTLIDRRHPSRIPTFGPQYSVLKRQNVLLTSDTEIC